MKISTFSIAVATCAMAMTAQASKTPVLCQGQPIEIKPISYAPIDANGNIIGSWQLCGFDDFSPGNVVYDCYESNPGGSGQPDEFRTPNWGLGGNRYFFGQGYKNMFCINDFTTVAGYGGGKVKRMNFAYSFRPVANEQLFVSLKVYDTFVDAATAPGATGFIEGYVVNLGVVAPDLVNYYYSNLTLTGGNDWNMPADGSGAIEIKFLKSQGPDVQSTEAEPMLWFIKPNQSNAGAQGPNQWDDDTSPFGTHQNGEWYSYALAAPEPAGNTTLEPMGAMVGMYADYLPTVAANGYLFIQGFEIAGDLASLATSDDNSLIGFNDENPPLACEIEFYGTVLIQNPSSLVINFETSGGRPGLLQSAKEFRYSTNAFVSIQGGTCPTADVLNSVTISSSAANYVGPAKAVKMRLLWQPINDEDPSQDGWPLNVDLVTWSTY